MNVFKDDEEPLDVVETRKVKRITVRNVFDNFLESFSLERGGIFTVKSLFTHPGKTVIDYLGANRYHYTPPFRILIVSTAVVLYLISISQSSEGFEKGFQDSFSAENNKDVTESIMNTVQNFFNLLIWSLIPFMALFSYLLNRKLGFNYAEHLVFQTYAFCITNIITFLVVLDHFIHPSIVFGISGIGSLFYFIFAYRDFTNRSWIKSIFHTIIIYIMSSIMWMFALFAIGVVIGVLLKMSGKM
jgi:hypothetical protein